jgi:hypothetical protein
VRIVGSLLGHISTYSWGHFLGTYQSSQYVLLIFSDNSFKHDCKKLVHIELYLLEKGNWHSFVQSCKIELEKAIEQILCAGS